MSRQTSRFRALGAFCLIGAPTLLLAAHILAPSLKSGENETSQLARVAQHSDRFYASTVLNLISIMLLLPALFVLVQPLRKRGARFGFLGAAAALVGAISIEAGLGASLVVWQMAQVADRAQMVALLKRANTATGSFLFLGPLQALLGLGIVLIAIGLYRARTFPRWQSILLGLAAPALAANHIVGATVLLLALGSMSWRILATHDANNTSLPNPTESY